MLSSRSMRGCCLVALQGDQAGLSDIVPAALQASMVTSSSTTTPHSTRLRGSPGICYNRRSRTRAIRPHVELDSNALLSRTSRRVGKVLLIDGRQAQSRYAVPTMLPNGHELIGHLMQ